MAGMKSIIIKFLLVCVYIPHFSQGFLCIVKNVKPGLKYDGTHRNIHGVHVGASQPFRCYDMYQDSRTYLTCVGAYKWSDPSPPCKLKTCDPPLSVKNGNVKILGWEVGNSAIYTCNEGLWYRGENPRICQKNNTWSGRDGRCEEVSCPSPDVPNNGRFNEPPPYKYKSQLKVVCNTGFVYNGSKELVCLTHNTWEGTVGQCLDEQLITCQELTVALNVRVIPLRKEHGFNDTIHLSCPEGYIYNGTTRRTCQVDGSWSGQEGNCNIKTCPPYVPVGVGWVEPACSPCEYRDTVRVVCPQGYNYNGTELTCNQLGHWTGTKENCTAIPCDDPVVAGGSVVGSGFVYKDEANIRCHPGYTWVGDYPQALCDGNATWQIHGNCSVLVDLQSASASSDKHKSTIAAAVCVPLLLVVLVIACVFIYRRFFLKKSKMHMKSEEDIEQSIPLTDQVFKAAILKDGHVTNRDLDKRIDLDTQFIKLRLVSGEDACKMNDILPDRYQDYLQKTGGKNIEIKDLLNYVKVKKGKYGYHTSNKATFVKQRRPLLLEGRGGVGKSTLVQKLMRLWAQNEWATEYKAAFLFNIRSLTVVDKRRVSLVDFFKRFGVYVLRDNTEEFTLSTLREHEDKIIMFMDGVDEFSGLAQKLGRNRKDKIRKSSEPLTWCLDILQRDVLGESVLILASRPFRDLAAVKCDPILEIVGLTREAILEFIDCHVGQDCETEEEKAANKERVKKTMTANSLVMSVSAITYFCMLFCQVLEENVNVALEELTTYTRIAAFFIQNYLSRNPSLPSAHVKPSTFLPQLAHLAYNGLVKNRVNDDIARLVFDKKHLEAVHLTKEQSNVAGDCGILLTYCITQDREEHSKPETDFTYEFVHLSVQELLAMLELSQKDTDSLIKKAKMMWGSSSFNVAKMYLYGLHFDTENENIQKLMQSLHMKVGKHGTDQSALDDRLIDMLAMTYDDESEDDVSEDDEPEDDASVDYESDEHESEDEVPEDDTSEDDVSDGNELEYEESDKEDSESEESDEHESEGDVSEDEESKDLLQLLQVTYETQNDEVVKKVADRRFKESSELKLAKTLLTAIDMNAIIFMLKHIRNTNSLRLTELTMDDTCVELLSGYLKTDTHLTELSMEGTQLSTTSIRNIMESFGCQPHQESLNLSRTGIDESSMSVVVDRLSKASSITTLRLAGNKIGKAESLLKLFNIITATTITELDLSRTGLDESSISVLVDRLSKASSITTLRLAGNKIGEADPLLKLLNTIPDTKIAELDLSDTGIDESSMSVLADQLPKASSITSLSLARNDLGSTEQLLELFNILPQTSITKLSLLDQNVDSALAVAAALSTDTYQHSISLQCDWRIYDNDETIPAVMKELISNKTLQLMWLTDEYGDTSTLVYDPGTKHRVRVEAELSFTYIYAWTPADITKSSILSHDGVVWGGDELCLYLNEFSSIYGEDCPVVSCDVWSQLLHDVTQCKHRVRELEVSLSPSSPLTPLTPLLTSITSHWGALIHKQVKKVDVYYGEVTCCDLHTWYTSLTTQPGWSVRARYDKYGRAEGAEITNTYMVSLWLYS